MIPTALLLVPILSTLLVDAAGPVQRADEAAARTAEQPVRVSARLDAERLEVGREHELVLELELAEGLDAGGAGLPGAIVQLDVPPSVELAGEPLTTHAELSKNQYLRAPYERLVEEFPVRIRFRLTSEPGDGERLGLNVVGYLRAGEGERDGFLRRRLELPLEPGATGREVDPVDSSWGTEAAGLQIGDRATDFTIRRADGSELALSHFLGAKRILVTTYRAHW